MSIAARFMQLPRIPLLQSLAVCGTLVLAMWAADWATPRLLEVEDAPQLEDTVPRQFGDWKELANPYAQVGVATGVDPNMDQPYDQTVMRTYINSRGQQVMLALAWGKRQRQEVKIHRPDLCYVAQGYRVRSLQAAQFEGIAAPGGRPVLGKHMHAATDKGGEAVSYWMRIGQLFSEDALATRLHIMKEGLDGRVPDGILVRASMRTQGVEDTRAAWPVLDDFLKQLAGSVPPSTAELMLGRAR